MWLENNTLERRWKMRKLRRTHQYCGSKFLLVPSCSFPSEGQDDGSQPQPQLQSYWKAPSLLWNPSSSSLLAAWALNQSLIFSTQPPARKKMSITSNFLILMVSTKSRVIAKYVQGISALLIFTKVSARFSLQPVLYMVQELQQTSSLARVDGTRFLCSQ